jgi:hypothetical protein
MSRSPISIVVLFLVFTCIPNAEGFTISLAPLLTRLAPWGNNYVNQFSESQSVSALYSSDEHIVQQRVVVQPSTIEPETKPFALDNLKFEEVDTLSDYKSEILDDVYSRSMDRGFA